MAGISNSKEKFLSLDMSAPIWDHFFTVAPLIVIGTKENEGYDMAPKHMATPLGHDNYFGFVCTPKHATYRNILDTGFFTVSYPKVDQVVLTSLTSSPRCEDGSGRKVILEDLPTFKAPNIDALFLDGSYLLFECKYLKVIDGFGENSFITGKIISAFIDKSYLRISDNDEQEMVMHAPLLAYLAYGRFAEVKKSLAFPFPKNFNY